MDPHEQTLRVIVHGARRIKNMSDRMQEYMQKLQDVNTQLIRALDEVEEPDSKPETIVVLREKALACSKMLLSAEQQYLSAFDLVMDAERVFGT